VDEYRSTFEFPRSVTTVQLFEHARERQSGLTSVRRAPDIDSNESRKDEGENYISVRVRASDLIQILEAEASAFAKLRRFPNGKLTGVENRRRVRECT